MILRALLSSYLHRTRLKGITSGIVRIVFVCRNLVFFCVDTDVAMEHAVSVSEIFTFHSFSWLGQGCPFFPFLLDHIFHNPRTQIRPE